MLADQLAIRMGDTFRLIDKNSENRIVASTLKLQVDKLITLAFNNLCNELPDAVPIDSHTHNNKKVGETPTRKSPRREYRCGLVLNQPPFDNDLTMNTANTAANPSAVLYSRLARYCLNEKDRSNCPKFRKEAGNSVAITSEIFGKEPFQVRFLVSNHVGIDHQRWNDQHTAAAIQFALMIAKPSVRRKLPK